MKHLFSGEFCSVVPLVLCNAVQSKLLVSSQVALGKVFPGADVRRILPLCSAPGSPYLASWVQFCIPLYRETWTHWREPRAGHRDNDRAGAPLL